MELAKILTADVLDIVFEGRNKTYGAYELRKTYKRRMLLSLAATGTIILLFVGSMLLGNRPGEHQIKMIVIPDDQKLAKIEEPEKLPPPPPPKPPEPPKQIEMKQFVAPIIKPDDQVKPDEKPPEVAELEDVKIGNTNQDGVKDDNIVPPPQADAIGKGIIEAPQKVESDEPFMKVEIESEYPGGTAAWQRYLYKNIRYPQDAQDSEIQGTVMVQFIVDKEGNVSDVEAISGPEELRAEAVRVIRKSGKWIPAVQNKNKVKSYKRQPIGFKLNIE
ncbi:TonB family protein [Pseudoflavitalea sp. G-6-1-2]|uniref:energy transducer TonB n=1 Tax=Pseudoflavitalea sp. G-6-1-2 TaxID=2728841 RepID=UPI00146E73EA|nr:energy transducer TonB [Pseudoflavitalea sp. G-6-1-2]NML19272.1 TonB family protein [Pseudoflavitalea sp. G-6-1-2]